MVYLISHGRMIYRPALPCWGDPFPPDIIMKWPYPPWDGGVSYSIYLSLSTHLHGKIIFSILNEAVYFKRCSSTRFFCYHVTETGQHRGHEECCLTPSLVIPFPQLLHPMPYQMPLQTKTHPKTCCKVEQGPL